MVAGRSTARPAATDGRSALASAATDMPIFRPGPGPYALAIAMTAIRIGERLLEIGAGTPALFGALAAKVGLSGHAAGVSDQAAGADALKQAGAEAGALVDVEVASPASLPYDAESFDIVVVDATATPADAAATWLAEAYRVLRSGGRLIVVERTGRSRLFGLVQTRVAAAPAETIARALSDHASRPVRKLAERDGWRFTEGMKKR